LRSALVIAPFHDILRMKFTNPMLGIYAAHLLTLTPEPDQYLLEQAFGVEFDTPIMLPAAAFGDDNRVMCRPTRPIAIREGAEAGRTDDLQRQSPC
jgi:hypothetical protein